MPFIVELHPEAGTDYIDAYHWYEQKQKGLGERFLSSIREQLELIAASPEAYSTKNKKAYREAKVKTFPYVIVYKIYIQHQRIFVSSIHHTKRSASKKYRKLS